MYQKIVQMINFSQNISWTSYKILFTIKSGGLFYQNYLKYIISNYGKRFGMCCYFNSGFIKTAGRNWFLKIEMPLKDCNKNAWWPVYKTYFGLFTKDYLQQKRKCLIKEFFFQNEDHSISYIIFRKIILKILL